MCAQMLQTGLTISWLVYVCYKHTIDLCQGADTGIQVTK
jgi:hypothetical protein